MRKYRVNIRLTNGDEVQASAVADSAREALAKVTTSEQFLSFVAEAVADVEAVDVVPDAEETEAPTTEDSGRYLVQPSKEDGKVVLTDTRDQIVFVFPLGDFNAAKVTFLNGAELGAAQMAKSLREAAEWVSVHQSEFQS